MKTTNKPKRLIKIRKTPDNLESFLDKLELSLDKALDFLIDKVLDIIFLRTSRLQAIGHIIGSVALLIFVCIVLYVIITGDYTIIAYIVKFINFILELLGLRPR